MLKTYRTIHHYGQHEIVINKSRFIAYCKRAEHVQEAVDFIEEIKKKHHDATHHCSAYIIGEHDQHQKSNDDGEPSGTAGKPMLEVLKKMRLKDTVVVVTRYFGGVKLGAGGLIRAYGQATKEGCLATGIVERTLHSNLKVSVDYHWHGKLQNELQNKGVKIKDVHFLEKVIFSLLIPQGEEQTFSEFLTNLTHGEAQLQMGDSEYVEQALDGKI